MALYIHRLKSRNKGPSRLEGYAQDPLAYRVATPIYRSAKLAQLSQSCSAVQTLDLFFTCCVVVALKRTQGAT